MHSGVTVADNRSIDVEQVEAKKNKKCARNVVIMCSVRISSSRMVMEKLKGRGNTKTWFLFTARLDAGARFVCTFANAPLVLICTCDTRESPRDP